MKTIKKVTLLVLMTIIAALTLCACEKQNSITDILEGNLDTNSAAPSNLASTTYDETDVYTDWDTSIERLVTLNGNSISYNGTGALVDGQVITIKDAGEYHFTGNLSDGRIVVDAKEKTVRLIFDNVNINCSYSAPVFIQSSLKTVITLAEGSINQLKDGSVYTVYNAADQEPNATVFSKSNLTFNGTGTLNITASFNNAVQSKDSLLFMSGIYNITSVDDGMIGKDLTYIHDGTFNLACGGDGIKATNTTDPTLGNILVDNATVTVVSGNDALQAANSILIKNGNFNIKSGGGSTLSLTSSTESYKGVKTSKDFTVKTAVFKIDSRDDALHSNATMTIEGGTYDISSGDDGIHADSSIIIAGGDINIKKSYEGIESLNISILSGTQRIIASDDGINIAGGNDSSSVSGRPGQNGFGGMASSGGSLKLKDCYTVVNANGDGLDANGSIVMESGTVIVFGPTSNGNGAIDYDATFNIAGGKLIAIGSSGMAMAPSTSSAQYSILVNLTSYRSSGTAIVLKDAQGNNLYAAVSEKSFNSVVISGPSIQKGSFDLYLGGTVEGEIHDGCYSSITAYGGGTKYATLNVTSKVTTSGAQGGGGGGTPGGSGFRP